MHIQRVPLQRDQGALADAVVLKVALPQRKQRADRCRIRCRFFLTAATVSRATGAGEKSYAAAHDFRMPTGKVCVDMLEVEDAGTAAARILSLRLARVVVVVHGPGGS